MPQELFIQNLPSNFRRQRALLQFLGPPERFEDGGPSADSSENLIPEDAADPLLSEDPGIPNNYVSPSRKRIFPAVAVIFLLLGLGMFGLACYVSGGQILHADNKTICWLIMGSGFEVLYPFPASYRF